HLVDSSSIAIPVFSTTTFTYSPYLLINPNIGPVDDVPVIRGADFQEVLSNFPLASQFLTGLFLEMAVTSPGINGMHQTEQIQKTLLDRIGFATRQTGGGGSMNLGGDPVPALSDFDVVTLVISASRGNDGRLADQRQALDQLGDELDALEA